MGKQNSYGGVGAEGAEGGEGSSASYQNNTAAGSHSKQGIAAGRNKMLLFRCTSWCRDTVAGRGVAAGAMVGMSSFVGYMAGIFKGRIKANNMIAKANCEGLCGVAIARCTDPCYDAIAIEDQYGKNGAIIGAVPIGVAAAAIFLVLVIGYANVVACLRRQEIKTTFNRSRPDPELGDDVNDAGTFPNALTKRGEPVEETHSSSCCPWNW